MGLLSTIGAASGRAFGLTRVGAAIRDAYFNLTTLLLPGNGTNGAQNNTFLDSSSNNFTITRNGNTTQGTFSPFSQTGWSNNFVRASSQYLTVSNSSGDFSFGTGAFTIECWVNLSSLPSGTGYPASYWIFGGGPVTNDIGIDFYINNTQIGFNLTTFVTATAIGNHGMSVGNWYHVAVVRGGGSNQTVSIYVNGTRVATASSVTATADAATTGIAISAAEPSGATSGNFDGYISNYRVVKGTAVYDPTASTLTVPTASLTAITNTVLLTCQSNRFIDTNTQVTAKTITVNGTPSVQAFSPFAPTAAYSAATVGGSGYFDGSDWLTVGAASDWTFMHNGSDWTCEFWVYHTGTAAYTIASTTAFSAQIGFTIAINSTYASGLVNGAQLYIVRGDGVSEAVFNSTALLVPNQWNYVAITFTSSTKTCAFTINGASAGSTANTGFSYSTSAPTNTLAIGRFQGTSPSNYLVGYLGSLRISTNIRTGLTTIPTSPYTSDANTKLLTNYTNAGITDATAKNVLETIGNAQISTTQSKFGGSSMSFDGTGDYLVTPSSPNNILGSGDFTVELWVYPSNTSSAYRALVASENYDSVTGGWTIYQNGTSLEIWLTGSINLINATSALTANTWQHVALSRSSGTVRLFVNGTSVGSASNSAAWTGQRIFVGDNNVSGADYFYNGYIDDLRITRGYARYTAAFTAPTAAFALQ